MTGVIIAVVLITSLVLARLTMGKGRMSPGHPLDVDEGLPLPELAQSSTVFSLTALFGAYFAIASTLGLPALMGLACGTVLGLFFDAYWINSRYWSVKKPEERHFEGFLFGLLKDNGTNAAVYAVVISLIQCAYAASELLILRELARQALGFKSQHATLLAIIVAIIGYFYVLIGGYMALFRTDVVQLVLVGVLAIICGAILLWNGSGVGWTSRLFPVPKFWLLPFAGSSRWLYLYHFALATIMGAGFMLASPDTWKRVYQVIKREAGPRTRALSLIGAGTIPYIVLLPFAISINLITDGNVKPGFMQASPFGGNVIFTAAALGMIASFLSSFDSALLASAHIQLIHRRTLREVPSEEPRFHVIIITFSIVWLLFLGGLAFTTNAWLLGNLLMGAYAAIAGIQIGTRGDLSRLRAKWLHWIFAIAALIWVTYFVVKYEALKVPGKESVNTVPMGVAVFFVSALLCLVFYLREGMQNMSLNDILDLLKGKNKPQLAQIIAFSLGPALIFIISAFLIFGSSMSFDKPVAISELKTALTEKGDRTPRRGVVLITDLATSDLVVPLPNSSTVWSSMDDGGVHANTLSGNLKLDAGQLHTKTPLADGAVTLVVDGDLGQDIYVSGVKESIEDWRLTSRESRSVISGVSAVGLLAFGIAFALGTSRVEPDKDHTGEVGAKPDKE